MAPTIWQKGHLNVNDRTAFPIEYLQPSADAGYACVQIMLNPDHPSTALNQVPVSYIKDIRSTGMKAFGFIWADDFQSPEALFEFVKGWRKQTLDAGYAITGFVINCEDVWEAKDQATAGGWSKKFLALFRADPLTAKLSLAINTYIGGGGIALDIWQSRGARLYLQTFHEGVTHEWPIHGYIPWAKFYGFTMLSMIKPNWGTYSPYPNRAEQIQSAKWAGTKGFAAWYAEGGGEPKDVIIPLLRESIAAGVCFSR